MSARLDVTGPGAEDFQVELESGQLTIGRRIDDSDVDVALDDPESLISRLHCVLDSEWGAWWVTDNASRNGTFVRSGDVVTRVTGRTRLEHGDAVLVTGRIDDGERIFWALELTDPNTTVEITGSIDGLLEDPDHVRWDRAAQRLEVVVGGEARVVELRRQGYMLIDYMASRNEENGAPIVATADELLEAIWGPREDWDPYRPPTVENLRDIVSAVRREIEPEPASPTLLENLRGVGYRIHTAARRVD